MNIDERLEAIARNLDTLTKIHLDNDREYQDRFQKLTEAQERLAAAQEKNTRDIELLKRVAEQDGENIRRLAHIAEIHEQRLDRLEDE